jgi:acetyl esterase/lipase
LVVAGSSAGAHLAVVTLLRLRDAGRHERVVAANLVFGAYDLGLTPTQRTAAAGLVIPLESLQACYRHAFPGLDREDRRHPSISPLYASLADLCPALLTVGTADPLLDDSLFLAARWQAAGNEARLDVYPDCPHAFPGFPIELGRLATERMAAWLDEVLSRTES